VLNEEERIEATVAAVCAWAQASRRRVHLIVVDNGSADATIESTDRALDGRMSAEVISCRVRGKGAAVRAGIASSHAPLVGYCDADLATLLSALEITQKGLDYLLEAYAGVAHRIGQDLLLAGDGPDAARLAVLARDLGIAERVHFVGRINPVDRGRWLAARDLVVVPSRYETFGIVAAEALAAATPVVAFDIPCLRSLVSVQTGVLVPPFDVAALAAPVEALATDPTRRCKLGAAGPDTVSPLRWDALAAAQGGLYRARLRGDGSACCQPADLAAAKDWQPEGLVTATPDVAPSVREDES
jgi:glycosyltransferase involved in cell wall biosynthesis